MTPGLFKQLGIDWIALGNNDNATRHNWGLNPESFNYQADALATSLCSPSPHKHIHSYHFTLAASSQFMDMYLFLF